MAESSGLEFLSIHPFVRTTVVDKARGAIVGAILGDCLGLYTEFLSKQISLEAYPVARFQLVEPATPFHNDGHRNKFAPRSWTDDTDHALLVVLSYLHCDGNAVLPDDIAARLRTWCEQGLRCLERIPLGLGRTVGRVVLDKSFLSNPSLTAHKYWVAGDFYAAPNGSLMRTHPLGVICLGKTLQETFRTTRDLSLITHADSRCVLACCISTGLIRGILRGDVQREEDIEAMIAIAFEWVEDWVKRGRRDESTTQTVDEIGDSQKTEPALDRTELYNHTAVKDFKELQLDDSMKMGYVYKSLGAAILSLRMGIQKGGVQHNSSSSDSESLRSNIFESIITNLIMEGGDADTNASIAGALLGSWLGYTALPSHWRDGIDHHDWVLHKCDALDQVIGIAHSLPDYKGSEDPDTREDGGKGFLGKEALEAREMAFMEMYLTKGAERNPTRKPKKGWREKLFQS